MRESYNKVSKTVAHRSGDSIRDIQANQLHSAPIDCDHSPRTATICGTKGVIRVAYPFWCPTSFTVQTMTGPASQQWGEEGYVRMHMGDNLDW